MVLKRWPFVRHFVPLSRYPYSGEVVACNLCGSQATVTIGRVDRRLKFLNSVCCAKCGLIRTDPMPTAEELSAYYAQGYRLDYQFALGSTPPRHHIKRSSLEARARMVFLAPALQPGTRVLDFGAGSGEFLGAAQEAGCDVIGIEPGRSYAAFARNRYSVTVLHEEPAGGFPAERFDVITTHHVLEHVRDPVDVLERLAAWLAPEGILYVSVPNMLATQKPPHERFHFAHVHGFVPETLDLAASRCGLEPDDRFPRAGTTAVYRKTGRITAAPAAPEVVAHIIELYPQRSPLLHMASGAWLWPMVRRNVKAVKDSFG